jgi:hypothetical protein
LGVLPLHLEDQVRTILHPDEKVRPVLVDPNLLIY